MNGFSPGATRSHPTTSRFHRTHVDRSWRITRRPTNDGVGANMPVLLASTSNARWYGITTQTRAHLPVAVSMCQHSTDSSSPAQQQRVTRLVQTLFSFHLVCLLVRIRFPRTGPVPAPRINARKHGTCVAQSLGACCVPTASPDARQDTQSASTTKTAGHQAVRARL